MTIPIKATIAKKTLESGAMPLVLDVWDKASNADISAQYFPLQEALESDFSSRGRAKRFLNEVIYPAMKSLYQTNDPTDPVFMGNCSIIWVRDGKVKIGHQYVPKYDVEEGGQPIELTLVQFRNALEAMHVYVEKRQAAAGDPEKLKNLSQTFEL